jgi:hypothetical protein
MGTMRWHARDKTKLEFTKKEFLTLLQVFEIADWVLDADSNEEADENGEFSKLLQKVYSHAGEYGCGSLIADVSELQEYLPSEKYEETCSMMDLIEKFENETFWEELMERLSERDAIREMGEKAFRKLGDDERSRKIEEYRKKYLEEFEKNGVERLHIRS